MDLLRGQHQAGYLPVCVPHVPCPPATAHRRDTSISRMPHAGLRSPHAPPRALSPAAGVCLVPAHVPIARPATAPSPILGPSPTVHPDCGVSDDVERAVSGTGQVARDADVAEGKPPQTHQQPHVVPPAICQTGRPRE